MSKLHPALEPIKFQRTFFMIKPDGVMRGLIGDILARVEKVGLKVIAIKMVVANEQTIRDHYPMNDETWVKRLGTKSLSGFENVDVTAEEILGSKDETTLGKAVADNLVNYMTSAPVVCMVIEGIQAIDMMRKLAGHTLPFLADVGTIRGDYSVDSPAIANAEKRSIHNLVHASENPKEANNEINLWFKPSELHDYQLSHEGISYRKYY